MVIPLRGLVIHWTILAFRLDDACSRSQPRQNSRRRFPHGRGRRRRRRASGSSRDRRGVLHRPVSRDQRRVREVRPRDRPPGAVDRRAAAHRVGRPADGLQGSRDTLRLAGRPSARRPRQSSRRARAVRRRGGVLRVAVGSDRPRPSGSRPRPSGRRPRAAAWKGMRYPWGNDFDPSRCSYLSDRSAKRQRGTRPTGTYPPNAFGLCDMIGNVWEWVSDWYDPEYYSSDDHRNPAGPRDGSHARRARRIVGDRRCRDAALFVSPQGAARHLRVQHRLPHRACGASSRTSQSRR